MTQTSPNPSTPSVPSPAAPAVEDDDLSHLYKMSRTAGLGSQDYVAINVVAVVAIIFGVASVLVIVSPLLMIIPIAGVVLGMIAVRQIRNSNGTQTGGLMAGLALLLSIGFLGFRVVGESVQEYRVRHDKQEITALIDSLGQDLATMNPTSLANAYSRFDSHFTQRVPQQHFESVWMSTRASSASFYGPLKSMHSNGQVKFDLDSRTGENTAVSIAVVSFERGESPRWTMIFRQTGGKWQIEDMPDVFPAPAPAPVPPGPPGQPGTPPR